MAKINELKYKMVDHQSYSPDLALSDYYLFPNLKFVKLLHQMKKQLQPWMGILQTNLNHFMMME